MNTVRDPAVGLTQPGRNALKNDTRERAECLALAKPCGQFVLMLHVIDGVTFNILMSWIRTLEGRAYRTRTTSRGN